MHAKQIRKQRLWVELLAEDKNFSLSEQFAKKPKIKRED
jgi:hypothetical protein